MKEYKAFEQNEADTFPFMLSLPQNQRTLNHVTYKAIVKAALDLLSLADLELTDIQRINLDFISRCPKIVYNKCLCLNKMSIGLYLLKATNL